MLKVRNNRTIVILYRTGCPPELRTLCPSEKRCDNVIKVAYNSSVYFYVLVLYYRNCAVSMTRTFNKSRMEEGDDDSFC